MPEKLWPMLKLDANKPTNRQTNKQTDRQTDKQTGQKQYAPDHSIRGHKNMCVSSDMSKNIRVGKNITV